MRMNSNVRVLVDGEVVFDGHNAPTAKGNEWFMKRLFTPTDPLGAKSLADAAARLRSGPSATTALARVSVAGGVYAFEGAPTSDLTLQSIEFYLPATTSPTFAEAIIATLTTMIRVRSGVRIRVEWTPTGSPPSGYSPIGGTLRTADDTATFRGLTRPLQKTRSVADVEMTVARESATVNGNFSFDIPARPNPPTSFNSEVVWVSLTPVGSSETEIISSLSFRSSGTSDDYGMAWAAGRPEPEWRRPSAQDTAATSPVTLLISRNIATSYVFRIYYYNPFGCIDVDESSTLWLRASFLGSPPTTGAAINASAAAVGSTTNVPLNTTGSRRLQIVKHTPTVIGFSGDDGLSGFGRVFDSDGRRVGSLSATDSVRLEAWTSPLTVTGSPFGDVLQDADINGILRGTSGQAPANLGTLDLLATQTSDALVTTPNIRATSPSIEQIGTTDHYTATWLPAFPVVASATTRGQIAQFVVSAGDGATFKQFYAFAFTNYPANPTPGEFVMGTN